MLGVFFGVSLCGGEAATTPLREPSPRRSPHLRNATPAHTTTRQAKASVARRAGSRAASSIPKGVQISALDPKGSTTIDQVYSKIEANLKVRF